MKTFPCVKVFSYFIHYLFCHRGVKCVWILYISALRLKLSLAILIWQGTYSIILSDFITALMGQNTPSWWRCWKEVPFKACFRFNSQLSIWSPLACWQVDRTNNGEDFPILNRWHWDGAYENNKYVFRIILLYLLKCCLPQGKYVVIY